MLRLTYNKTYLKDNLEIIFTVYVNIVLIYVFFLELKYKNLLDSLIILTMSLYEDTVIIYLIQLHNVV